MSSTPSQAIPHIFVSHSHADNDYCRAFVNGLRTRSLDVWYDEHNLGWGMLHEEIGRELEARACFIVILSPASVQSIWVRRELATAFALEARGRVRYLLAVVAQHCDVPTLLLGYRVMQKGDGEPMSVDEAVARTVQAIAPTHDETISHAPAPVSAAPAQADATFHAAPAASTLASPPARLTSLLHLSLTNPIERFAQRLIALGFTAHRQNGIEYIQPPLCDAPAGEFLMGSDAARDPQARDNEKPQHTITLSAYQIARFPVTVAEYACFVRSGQKEPASPFNKLTWKKQLERQDHPVVNVSWHDAAAYAAWLAHLTGLPWRLPTEAEWEKAARGTDGRLYPWGDAFDATRCNIIDSGINTTTPVGAYPAGMSPSGVQDLAGNVWEWTSTLYEPYPYNQNDGRESVNFVGDRVLRGGSWYLVLVDARAACRYHRQPDNLRGSFGFRLVLAAPGS